MTHSQYMLLHDIPITHVKHNTHTHTHTWNLSRRRPRLCLSFCTRLIMFEFLFVFCDFFLDLPPTQGTSNSGTQPPQHRASWHATDRVQVFFLLFSLENKAQAIAIAHWCTAMSCVITRDWLFLCYLFFWIFPPTQGTSNSGTQPTQYCAT